MPAGMIWFSNRMWNTIRMSDQKLFFDTDCLSAFLWVNGQAILPELYPGRIVIPEPVYIELSRPQISHLKRRIDLLKNNHQATLVPLNHGEPEYDLFWEMVSSPRKGMRLIGRGEASAIALAKVNGGIVASNNLRDILPYIEQFGLEYTTTGDILVDAYKGGLITETQGNSLWAAMLAKRRKLGANSFSDFLRSK